MLKVLVLTLATSFALALRSQPSDSWVEHVDEFDYHPASFAYGANRFAATTSSSWNYGSADGTAFWRSSKIHSITSFYKSTDLAYGAGTFVAVGTDGGIWTNPDPLVGSWTSRGAFNLSPGISPVPRITLHCVRYLNNQFLTGSTRVENDSDPDLSYSEVFTSPNGIIWTSHKFPAPNTGNLASDLVDVAFRPGSGESSGTYVFATPDGSVLVVPEDLSSASRIEVPGLISAQGVIFAEDTFLLTSKDGYLFKSPTGAADTWTEVPLPFQPPSLGRPYHDGSRFALVGGPVPESYALPTSETLSVRPPTLLFSDNGTDWTLEVATVSTPITLKHIIHADGLWIAGGDSKTILTRGTSSVTGPAITLQPTSVSAITGSTITLTAAASGTPTPSVRWTKVGASLVENVRISGVTTNTLTITDATLADAGSYQFSAANPAGAVTSAYAKISVEASKGGAVLTPLEHGFVKKLAVTSQPPRIWLAPFSGSDHRIFQAGAGSHIIPIGNADGWLYADIVDISADGMTALRTTSGRPPGRFATDGSSFSLYPSLPLPFTVDESVTFTSITSIEPVAFAANGNYTGFVSGRDTSTGSITHTRAFHYDLASNTYTLLAIDPANPEQFRKPYAITEDGTTIVGQAHRSATELNLPFVWSKTEGYTHLPILLEGMQASIEVAAPSPSGRYITGYAHLSQPGTKAVRWDRGAALDSPTLQPLPGSLESPWARGTTVSDDGTVGGYISPSAFSPSSSACLWMPAGNLVILADYLTDTYGFNLNGFQLTEVTGISQDGRTLTGEARHAEGYTKSWILTLPKPIFVAIAPRFSVRSGETDLASGATLAFGNLLPSYHEDKHLKLHNTGITPLALASISLTGPHSADFTLITDVPPDHTTLPATLEVGTYTYLNVRFQPSPASRGTRTATLTIATNDPETPSFTLNLTAHILLPEHERTLPVITFPQPADYIFSGSPIVLTLEDLGISASTGATPTLDVVSGPASIIPNPDTGLAEVHLTGFGSVSLRATLPGDGDLYHDAEPVAHRLKVRPVPPVAVVDPIVRKAGNAFSLPLATPSTSGLTYHASGLPSGLSLDAITGELTGTLSASPGTYTITYWTQAGLVQSEPRTLTLTVAPFPAKLTGKFEGLFVSLADPKLPVAKLQLTVTNTGAFTGRLTHGAPGTATISGQFTLDATNTIATLPSLTKGAHTITDLTLDTTSGLSAALSRESVLTGELADGVKLASFSGTSEDRPAWAGAYTAAFVRDGNIDPAKPKRTAPRGRGYATGSVSPTGVLSLKGKLADGTSFSGSFGADNTAGYRLFVQPYDTANDYLGGWLKLTHWTKTPSPRFRVSPADGQDLYWHKSANPEDSHHRDGFGPLSLQVKMATWLPPTTEEPLSTRLGLSPANARNLTLDALGADLTSRQRALLSAPARLTSENTLVIPDASKAKRWKNLMLNPADGLLTGTLRVYDTTTESRTANARGVLLQLPPAEREGTLAEGFFLLPPVSGPQSETQGGGITLTTP